MPISSIAGMRFKKYLAAVIIFFVLPAGALYGQDTLEGARNYAERSRQYYHRAVELYQEAIAKGRDLNRLHFELGELYYNYGEFSNAVSELKKTNYLQAAKLTAISFYRLGDFTDALAAFDKGPAPDDEARYYRGLTCEKLNLFDEAVKSYREIRSPSFVSPARERLNAIEKLSGASAIKDTAPETYALISSSPGQKEYPQAGALYLYCEEDTQIFPDNTQESRLHYVIKILNERGKEHFSESHIDYDSTYEKVELEYARTIKPDGSVTEVGSRHIRDVSKYLNFPLYSNARVFIISFPEVTEGCVIEYKVKIRRNQLVNKKDFVTTYSLQADEPVMAARFAVRLPRARALHVKAVNSLYNNFGAELLPKIEERAGDRIYYWQFKNIPQILPESNILLRSKSTPRSSYLPLTPGRRFTCGGGISPETRSRPIPPSGPSWRSC